MAEYATKDDVNTAVKDLGVRIDKKIDKAVDDLTGILTVFMRQVDDRFNAVEKRLDDHDKKFDILLGSLPAYH